MLNNSLLHPITKLLSRRQFSNVQILIALYAIIAIFTELNLRCIFATMLLEMIKGL